MNTANPAGELLDRLRASGVTLTPAIDLDGPADILTDDTLQFIRDHKPALLALLIHPKPTDDVLSSVSPRATVQRSPDPQSPSRRNYGTPGGSLLADVVDVFPEAEVIRTTTTPASPAVQATNANPYRITATTNPQRQPVLDFIANVFDHDPDKASGLRDAWHERMAICTIDGRLTAAEAEVIAWNELQQAVKPP